MRKKRVIISATSDLTFDQRVHRVASTLKDAGFEVLVVGTINRFSRTELGERPYATHRFKMFFLKGKFFYLEYMFRLFWFLLFKRVDVLNSNDMDTLLPNFLVAKFRRKDLVYDSHEYFTEVPELVSRPGTRRLWLAMERWMFPRLKWVYTVNTSIADIYRNKYGVEVGAIRNLPFKKEAPARTGAAPRLVIYQGALNPGRGLEMMIESMRHLPGYQFWIAGVGDEEEKLKALVEKWDLGEQVTFKGLIPFEELAQITQQAGVGLSLEEARGESYRLALPNKLFDYIQSAVPVIVADLPEMKRVVEEWQVGLTLSPEERKPEVLAQKIRAICEDERQWQEYCAHCLRASAELCWENEREKLLEIYRPFLYMV